MNNQRKPLIALLAITLLSLFALSACGALGNVMTGSGNVVTQELDFTEFDEVSISHAFTATISTGETYSVVVRIDDNLVDRLLAEQVGSRVNIGLEPTTLTTQATMEVDITLPKLSLLEASGATQVQLNDVITDSDFAAHASGASRIQGQINARNLDLQASGASTVALVGAGADLRANASGASRIDGENLTVGHANVEASGASTVIVSMNGTLDASASGGSNIHYQGDVTLGSINESGGSNVEPR